MIDSIDQIYRNKTISTVQVLILRTTYEGSLYNNRGVYGDITKCGT